MKRFFMAELKVLGVFALIDHPVTPYHSHQPVQRYFYENCVKNMKLSRSIKGHNEVSLSHSTNLDPMDFIAKCKELPKPTSKFVKSFAYTFKCS